MHPADMSIIFIVFVNGLALFLVATNTYREGNFLALQLQSLHSVHHLVTNFFLLLFSAKQVVSRFFCFQRLSVKTAACCS